MKIKNLFFNFLILFIVNSHTKAQPIQTLQLDSNYDRMFVGLGLGVQMSGIKDEDFVESNYSPLLKLTAGKYIWRGIGFQAGYKGLWFNTISDDVRHYYTFFYTELLLNSNAFLTDLGKLRSVALEFHGGPGFFYNHHYARPNICGNFGGQLISMVSPNLSFLVDVDAVVGWDIYQGNLDILPGVGFGFTYWF